MVFPPPSQLGMRIRLGTRIYGVTVRRPALGHRRHRRFSGVIPLTVCNAQDRKFEGDLSRSVGLRRGPYPSIGALDIGIAATGCRTQMRQSGFMSMTRDSPSQHWLTELEA